MRWQRVRGIVQRGHGVASGIASDSRFPEGTIRLQMPLFRERGLDLFRFYPGTLNLSIAPHEFELRKPQFTFEHVEWTSVFPAETFSFSRCRIHAQGKAHEGFIYYPHPETKPDHFQSASTIEVITTFLGALRYGAEIELEINPAEVSIR
jgi:hypothetical protein